jgi:hypothetical protein
MIISKVKIHLMKGQSAEVHTSCSAFQRANAEYLEWLVGFTDGDGSFCLIDYKPWLNHRFSIGLHLRDIQLLYKIKTNLGIGRVEFNTERALYVISDMNHLIDNIVPIFDASPCLSRKFFQYKIWRETLLQRKEGIPLLVRPEYAKDIAYSLKPIEEILALPYFDNWLVGFIEAEGSFSISIEDNGKRIRPYFYIDQKFDYHLMEAIRQRLSFNSKILLRREHMFCLSGKSKREIENVVSFLKTAKVKLQGYKKIQFLLWLKELRKLDAYQHISIPVNY